MSHIELVGSLLVMQMVSAPSSPSRESLGHSKPVLSSELLCYSCMACCHAGIAESFVVREDQEGSMAAALPGRTLAHTLIAALQLSRAACRRQCNVGHTACVFEHSLCAHVLRREQNFRCHSMLKANLCGYGLVCYDCYAMASRLTACSGAGHPN